MNAKSFKPALYNTTGTRKSDSPILTHGAFAFTFNTYLAFQIDIVAIKRTRRGITDATGGVYVTGVQLHVHGVVSSLNSRNMKGRRKWLLGFLHTFSLSFCDFSPFSQLIFPLSDLNLSSPPTLWIYRV